MLLVIFGAGASYDSVHHLPPPKEVGAGHSNFGSIVIREVESHEQVRPPLACQLFENRNWFIPIMREVGDFGSLVTSLRTCNSVERRLAEIQKEAETIANRHRQLAAICYYLHSVIWACEDQWSQKHSEITNYGSFLEEIELWRRPLNESVCIVTFNYDRMIEHALQQVIGISVRGNDLSIYVRDLRYKLIKLHGSVDWGLEVDSRPGTARDIVNAAGQGLSITHSYRRAVQRGVVFDDGSVGYPAIAIPVDTKDEFVCPPEHITALTEIIPQVTKIIAIGWRATEQRFLEMLKNRLMGLKHDVDLMVVAGNDVDVRATVNNLAIGPANSECKRALRPDGFSALVNQSGRGHLKQFLG